VPAERGVPRRVTLAVAATQQLSDQRVTGPAGATAICPVGAHAGSWHDWHDHGHAMTELAEPAPRRIA
jgi:hypothetical protein